MSDSFETRGRISRSIVSLLKEHAFIGHLVQSLVIRTSESIGTAGVYFSGGRFRMDVAPKFFNSMTELNNTAIVKHEIYHLLQEHLSRGANYDKHYYNVAADLCINQYIDNLPEMSQKEYEESVKHNPKLKDFLKKKPNGNYNVSLCIEDFGLPPNLTTEQYYEIVTNKKDLKEFFEQKQYCVSGSPEGNHENWGKDGSPHQVKEELRRLLREAYNKAGKNFGSIPGNLVRDLENFMQGDVNWKVQLQSFIDFATISFKNYTRKRPNRRFGVTFKGKRNFRKLKLGVYVDTSGSIGSEELEMFGGEINKIFKTKMCDIEIMAGDTTTTNHFKMKGALQPSNFELNGGGGTDASAWVQYINDHDFDAAVILTDGYFDTNFPKSKTKLLWALTENGLDVNHLQKELPGYRYLKLRKDKKSE